MQSETRHRSLALVYAVTIFLSAFLLFQIQPIVSKSILPWFGGTPAVWTTCLLFFQSLLFAGYAYAHFSNTWFRGRQQAILHIAVIMSAIALLRVLPKDSWKPSGDGNPTWQILVMLTITIGLPYFVLSATGPLLQAWFARSFPGRSPYRLYALSNIGSLLALISYPFLLEHVLELPRQATLWSAGFIAFGLLCGYTAWRVFKSSSSSSGRGQGDDPLRAGVSSPTPDASAPTTYADASVTSAHEPPATNPQSPSSSPRSLHYLLWLLLPAFASIVLLATTNHVTTDVAVVPLLWVVPLALYLVTFIIAFDHPKWYRPIYISIVALVAIYVTCMLFKQNRGVVELYDCGITGKLLRDLSEAAGRVTKDVAGRPVGPSIALGFRTSLIANFTAMFAICFFCHGELARIKPHARYLTAYYLMMSAGGALGGLAVSMIAPHVFQTYFEWTLAIFAAAIVSIAYILYALVGRAVALDRPGEKANAAFAAWIGLVLLLLPSSLVLLDLVEYLYSPKQGTVFQDRNFFGTITIRERDIEDPQKQCLVLLNGTTIHGSQYMADDRRRQPTSYYAPESGIGQVLAFYRNNRPPGGTRIGDVGLGTGTLAAYVDKGEFLTFYEINPAVIEMASSGDWFTYIPDCRARGAKCDIKLGDARLTLEQEVKTPNLPKYHVLVLDAFSSDAVPVHLLTSEAFEIYLQRLAKAEVDGAEGALVVHISNRHLDLARVVRAVADKFKLNCIRINTPGNPAQATNEATWMVLTRNPELAATLAPLDRDPPDPTKPPILWTDARSSLWEIMK